MSMRLSTTWYGKFVDTTKSKPEVPVPREE
jgi:hypothetical protein